MDEASRAARIHTSNPGLGAYAVWTRYNPDRVKQADNPELLSRRTVEYLVAALDAGLLVWDEQAGRLKNPGETRAARTRIVIPRLETQS